MFLIQYTKEARPVEFPDDLGHVVEKFSSLLGGNETDRVTCVVCASWPIVAQEWISRPRPSGWPLQKIIQEITSKSCHVVPVSYRLSSFPTAEWRFSFSTVKLRLAQSLTVVQKQSYLLLKMIYNCRFKTESFITSYHMKTAFFGRLNESKIAVFWSTTCFILRCLCWSRPFTVSS